MRAVASLKIFRWKVLDEKVQKSYVSWHLRLIQRKANSWETCIFCVMQWTWSSQWKVLLIKCRENLGQLAWMKFIFIVNLYSFPPTTGPPGKSFLPQGKSFAPFHAEQLPKLPHIFLLTPLFWGYLNSKVRINKMINNLDYHPCYSRLASRTHPFIFHKLPRVLDLSPERLLNFL